MHHSLKNLIPYQKQCANTLTRSDAGANRRNQRLLACVFHRSVPRRCPVLMDGLCVRHLKQKCSVCLEPVGSTNTVNSKRLSCGHAFHVPCIMEWFVESDECPVCRSDQASDPVIAYKRKVEDILRQKYKDAIECAVFQLAEATSGRARTLSVSASKQVAANSRSPQVAGERGAAAQRHLADAGDVHRAREQERG